MDLYCHACKERKPMRRIRRPAYARPAGLFFLLASLATAAIHLFWPYGALGIPVAVGLAVVGRNYWQCEACGALTERE